jgi:hypothetical protein
MSVTVACDVFVVRIAEFRSPIWPRSRLRRRRDEVPSLEKAFPPNRRGLTGSPARRLTT